MINSQASTQEYQAIQDVSCSEEPITSKQDSWGRVFALKGSATAIDLTQPCHDFGRGVDIPAEHRFTVDRFGEQLYSALSKLHFRISKAEEVNSPIVLEDMSSNGTFVNEELVGKRKKVIIKNNDVISVAHKNQKVFIFYDCLYNDSKDYPSELLEKYTMNNVIGKGTYGEVRLAHCKRTLERRAVKILKKTIEGADNFALKNESELLFSVDHKGIIKLLDVVESEEKIYLVMELANGGELFDQVKKQRLSESVTKLYFYQLLCAVDYLHSRKITHRDIKLENILLATSEEKTCIKLTDFGLSKLAANSTLMTTMCGTPTYIAPELLYDNSYSNKVDMWSLGVVLFVCLAGYAPFHGEDYQLRIKIKKAQYSFNHSVWSTVSDLAKDLIKKLVVLDPAKRLSAAEALKHPWLDDKDMKEEVDRLMMPPALSQTKRKLEDDSPERQSKMIAKTPLLFNNKTTKNTANGDCHGIRL